MKTEKYAITNHRKINRLIKSTTNSMQGIDLKNHQRQQ